jgi:hypothetical protein
MSIKIGKKLILKKCTVIDLSRDSQNAIQGGETVFMGCQPCSVADPNNCLFNPGSVTCFQTYTCDIVGYCRPTIQI